MSLGVQFDNLNAYRRYPFADDVDLSCTKTMGVNSTPFVFPTSLIRGFRVVHVGARAVKTVKLTGVHYKSDVLGFSIDLRFLDAAGAVLPFLFNGKEVADTGVVTLSCVGEFDDVLFRVSDFDYSNCFTVYVGISVAELQKVASGSSFDIACDIPFASGMVFSLKNPHVTSILDDNGSSIRDCDNVEIVAGYNTKLDVIPDRNTIVVSAHLGGGEDGLACGTAGLSKTLPFYGLKTINGVSATPLGDFTLAGDNGIKVHPVEGTNVLNIYQSLIENSSASCEVK